MSVAVPRLQIPSLTLAAKKIATDISVASTGFDPVISGCPGAGMSPVEFRLLLMTTRFCMAFKYRPDCLDKRFKIRGVINVVRRERRDN